MCRCKEERAFQSECRRAGRRRGVFSTLFQVAMLYVVLVFGSGTLIQTGHPVAAEAGRLIQTVMLIEPTITWANQEEHDRLARGMSVLAHGIDLPWPAVASR